MKSVFMLGAILGCLTISSEANARPLFYIGSGLIYGKNYSNASMDYEMNVATRRHPNAKRNIHSDNTKNQKEISSEIFCGIKTCNQKGLYWAIEFGYNFGKASCRKDYLLKDNVELIVPSNKQQNDKLSYMSVKHGQELNLVSKFGFTSTIGRVYGILGVSSKNISIDYGVIHCRQIPGKSNDLHKSQRVHGLILGAGVAKDINKAITVSAEYKYKKYKNAKFDIDWKQSMIETHKYPHDKGNRNFKVKSHKQEIALQIAVNL